MDADHHDASIASAGPAQPVFGGPDGRGVEAAPASTSAPPRPSETVVVSREQLDVSTMARPARKVTVTKRVVTEFQTLTVPVRREELIVEEEDLPLGWAGDLPTLPETGSGFDLVLHEERVRVVTDVVAVERVHVGIRVVTDRVVVSEELDHEDVEVLLHAGTAFPDSPPGVASTHPDDPIR